MEKASFLPEFVAGQIAGLVGICTVYPLDTAKVRLQTSQKYTSTYDVLFRMSQKNGFTSLYRGLPSPALGFGLTFAISFRYLLYFNFYVEVITAIDVTLYRFL